MSIAEEFRLGNIYIELNVEHLDVFKDWCAANGFQIDSSFDIMLSLSSMRPVSNFNNFSKSVMCDSYSFFSGWKDRVISWDQFEEEACLRPSFHVDDVALMDIVLN